MPGMLGEESFDGAKSAVAVRRLWSGDVRDSRHCISRHQAAVDDMVSGDVASHLPKKRGKRDGAAASTRIGQLQDGLDLATQALASNGATGPGSAERAGGSG